MNCLSLTMTAYNEILINLTSENSPQCQIYPTFRCYLPATPFIANCLLFKPIAIFLADRNLEITSNNLIIFLRSKILTFALFLTLYNESSTSLQKVEPRNNTTLNGQPAYFREYSIAFFTDREAIISFNMQQDNIVSNFYSIFFYSE